ncbi:SLEI domain protein, PF07620 family [Leptospira interrogans serovar Bataviae str. UI 08561]|nr:SLEI domain protein, PF07620 family [Leptospira interrogans serovar Bataviae str. UI 08561]
MSGAVIDSFYKNLIFRLRTCPKTSKNLRDNSLEIFNKIQ